MNARRHPYGRGARAGGFLRDESGATLVEFAIVCSLFLLIFFALIDFGRLGYTWVMAEKAVQRAARIAAVRPPVCTGVPDFNQRPPGVLLGPEFGTGCSAAGFADPVCIPTDTDTGTAGIQPPTCNGVVGQATSDEIWEAINGLMPPGSDIANVKFTYDFDPALGFLGGPYVPVVTAELDGVTFSFVSPLGGLAQLAGAADADPDDFGTIELPAMSVSLPGEDLAQGNNG